MLYLWEKCGIWRQFLQLLPPQKQVTWCFHPYIQMVHHRQLTGSLMYFQPHQQQVRIPTCKYSAWCCLSKASASKWGQGLVPAGSDDIYTCHKNLIREGKPIRYIHQYRQAANTECRQWKALLLSYNRKV